MPISRKEFLNWRYKKIDEETKEVFEFLKKNWDKAYTIDELIDLSVLSKEKVTYFLQLAIRGDLITADWDNKKYFIIQTLGIKE